MNIVETRTGQGFDSPLSPKCNTKVDSFGNDFSQWPHPIPANEFRGIRPDVVEANVEFIPDLEIDPLTHEVIATPIDDFLGRPYTRFTRQAKPSLIAAKFGEWQLKIFGANKDGERTGNYQAPTGIGDAIFLPNIPLEIANRIVAKYCGPLARLEWETRSKAGLDYFWDFFLEHPEIPVIIAEGAKKALAAISEEEAAIAVWGCKCGVTNLTIKPELFPYVEGREVIIAYDQDTGKDKQGQDKAYKIFKAKKRLGNALTYHAKSKVKVMDWPASKGKGLDDLIANDPQLFHTTIAQAQDFPRWKLGNYTDLTPLVTCRLNRRYLGKLEIPEDARLVCIKSPKGTGKTESLAEIIGQLLAQGKPVIAIVHREQLAKELGRRFGLEYRTELTREGRLLGYVLCIDSLHPKANPPFNPDAWPEVTVVIDEVEQELWHTLNSDTCQFKRVAILETFTQLLRNAERVIGSDADLTRRSVDYMGGLMGVSNPWVVVNQWQATGKTAITYDKPQDWLSDLLECVKNGDRPLIHTAAQKVDSDYGSINLEKLIKTLFPDLRVLRIDREAVSTPGHPAYGCIGNLNEILVNYDVVITTPVMETGVSIDIKGHFNRVFAYGSGVQTVEAFGQSLERLREDVPRHIFVKKYSNTLIGNGSDDPYALTTSQQKNFKANVSLLGQADNLLSLDGETPQHLKTWSIYAACHNYGFKTYRESIYVLLKADGYRLIEAESPDDSQEVKELVKFNKTFNQENHYQAVSQAELLTDTEYQVIKDKRAKTESERLSEQKTAIAHRFATDEVTPDLVREDGKGLYGKLQLHYFMGVGSIFLKARDTKKVAKLAHNNKTFTPDLNRTALSVEVRVLKGLVERFFSGETFTNASLEAWYQDFVLACRRDIKTYLNQTINPEKDTPMGVAQRLLGLLGLKMECTERKRVNGKIVRFYALTNPNPDGREDIFARWFNRDMGTYADVPELLAG